jgi:hypothetical protein
MNSLKKIWDWYKAQSKKNKIIIGVILLILIGYSASKNQASYNDGVGELTHESKNDWNRNYTLDEIGYKIFEFVKLHNDAKKLIVNVKDECTDNKGIKSEYVSTITFSEDDLNKFEEYQDKISFTKNCSRYVAKMIEEWKPCGGSYI